MNAPWQKKRELIECAQKGDLTALTGAIEAGIDVNEIQDIGGWTLLHFAADAGQLKIVEWLVKSGAWIEMSAVDGKTALHVAARANNHQVCELLTKAGADPESTDIWGGTPLHDAASCDSVNTIQSLAAAGASVDFMDNDGRTPLMRACALGRAKSMQTLVALGADIDLKDNNNNSPLEMCSENEALQKILKKEKENVDPQERRKSARKSCSRKSTSGKRFLSLVVELKGRKYRYETEVGSLDELTRNLTEHLKLTNTAAGLNVDYFDVELDQWIVLDDLKRLGNGTQRIKITFPQERKSLSSAIFLEDVQVGEKLGGGSFGEVYAGFWQRTTPVALKTVKGEAMIRELEEEATCLQQLRHPNIVSFYGIYLDASKGCKFIVTEFLNLGDLKTLLQKHRANFTIAHILNMAIQTAAGMAYLTAKGIVHRDLAARNLLVSSGGEQTLTVKVADFGLSRRLSNDTYTVHSDMPIRWTAPEAFKYGQFYALSDVWSFGVVLYEMITKGGNPYAHLSNSSVVEEVLRGYRLPQPEECPDTLYAIMLECWREEARERPDFVTLHALLLACKDLLV